MSDLDNGMKTSRSLWVIGAVTALALHLGGGALALANLKGDVDEGGLGANGAEIIDIEMASPKVEEDDVPVGVDSQAQNASQALPEQQAEVEQTDLPKDVPTETEEADRVVTTSDVKKPTEEEKVAAVQTKASDAADAAEDSSRKALDEKAPEAEKAKAPNVGIGKDRERMTANWGRKISAYFELHKKFPEGKKKGANVKLALVLNRLGNIVSVGVAESSGDTAYDDAAVAMVHRSDPVPKPPAGLTDDQFSFTLPVNFNPSK
jgi:periplasmic protein TonB